MPLTSRVGLTWGPYLITGLTYIMLMHLRVDICYVGVHLDLGVERPQAQ